MTHLRRDCPVCAKKTLLPIVSFDAVPLVCNELYDDVDQARLAKTGPLELVFCRHCGHVFNASFDSSLITYSEGYDATQWYSGAFVSYVDELIQRLGHAYKFSGRTVVDIGCGKGELLKRLCAKTGAKGIGFDKSFTEYQGGSHADVTFINDWFSNNYEVTADFVICRHVLEHIGDPISFLSNIRSNRNVRRDTILYFEVPNGSYVLNGDGSWEIIYEHVSYFTLPSLSVALQRAGFSVIESGTSFGEQYLYAIVKPDILTASASRGTSAPLGVERMAQSMSEFRDLHASKICFWKEYFKDNRPGSVAVWGAGSKGITFANSLPSRMPLAAMVDLNPRKQGRFIPVTAVPVMPPQALKALPVQTIIIMNRQYEQEIARCIEATGIQASTLIA